MTVKKVLEATCIWCELAAAGLLTLLAMDRMERLATA